MPNMPTERGLLNHGSGKGDKERSSKWRANYGEIDWGILNAPGFIQRGVKQVKRYGGPAVYAWVICPAHGRMPLTVEQTIHQLDDNSPSFFCPKCNAVSIWEGFENETTGN